MSPSSQNKQELSPIPEERIQPKQLNYEIEIEQTVKKEVKNWIEAFKKNQ